MLTSSTEQYLDLARPGRNAWWRYALGVFVVVFSWLVLGYLPFFLLVAAGIETTPLADFVALNFSIFMMLAGLAVTMRFIHRRPLFSLVAPGTRLDWKRVRRAALCWLVLSAATAAGEHVLYPDRYYFSFDALRFLPFLVAVLVLTPIQCATEELVFRGYAMQGLGLLTRRPLVLAAVSSLAFTAPHMLNPEVAQHGVLIMAANYFAIGLLLALVTLRDGRLEMAIGLHSINNVFLALVANYEGSALSTESVYTARELDPVYSLVTLVAGGAIFYWWMFRNRPSGN